MTFLLQAAVAIARETNFNAEPILMGALVVVVGAVLGWFAQLLLALNKKSEKTQIALYGDPDVAEEQRNGLIKAVSLLRAENKEVGELIAAHVTEEMEWRKESAREVGEWRKEVSDSAKLAAKMTHDAIVSSEDRLTKGLEAMTERRRKLKP